MFIIEVPETDDESVKDIEAIADILNKAKGRQLEQHLHCEDGGKDKVAYFNDTRQGLRLVVVLNTHAEGVDKDAKQDSLLEDVVVDGEGQASSAMGEAGGEGSPASGQAAEHRLLFRWCYYVKIRTQVVDCLLLGVDVNALRQVVSRAIFQFF